MENYQDLSRFKMDPRERGRSALVVQIWWLVQEFLIRPSPQILYGWRRFWWRLFGAKLGRHVLIRPRVRVTYPWKVTLGDHVWIGDDAELYSLAPIVIGAHAVVSQRSYVCAGTHDYTRVDFALVAKPITIGDQAWIAADCILLPGVTVGRGCVVGAGSLVTGDLPEGMICAGRPAKPVKKRIPPA